MIPDEKAPYNAGADLLERAAARGNGRLLRCEERDTSGRDVAQLALALQNALRERGLGPGDRVLLLLRDTPAFYAGFLGAMRGGMIPIPVSTQLPAADAGFIARDAGKNQGSGNK